MRSQPTLDVLLWTMIVCVCAFAVLEVAVDFAKQRGPDKVLFVLAFLRAIFQAVGTLSICGLVIFWALQAAGYIT